MIGASSSSSSSSSADKTGASKPPKSPTSSNDNSRKMTPAQRLAHSNKIPVKVSTPSPRSGFSPSRSVQQHHMHNFPRMPYLPPAHVGGMHNHMPPHYGGPSGHGFGMPHPPIGGPFGMPPLGGIGAPPLPFVNLMGGMPHPPGVLGAPPLPAPSRGIVTHTPQLNSFPALPHAPPGVVGHGEAPMPPEAQGPPPGTPSAAPPVVRDHSSSRRSLPSHYGRPRGFACSGCLAMNMDADSAGGVCTNCGHKNEFQDLSLHRKYRSRSRERRRSRSNERRRSRSLDPREAER